MMVVNDLPLCSYGPLGDALGAIRSCLRITCRLRYAVGCSLSGCRRLLSRPTCGLSARSRLIRTIGGIDCDLRRIGLVRASPQKRKE
jgi:hypothetical protein